MDIIINFASKYYFIFIIITIFLLFALIGYFVKKNKKDTEPFKIKEEQSNELNIDNIQANQHVSLQDALKENSGMNNNNAPML